MEPFSVDLEAFYSQDGEPTKIADLCGYISEIKLDVLPHGMHVTVYGREGLRIGDATANNTHEAIALMPEVVQQALRRDLFGD